MAAPGNNRIAYSRSSLLGQRLGAFASAIVAARQLGQELQRVISAYGPDSASLAADLGAPDASQVSAVTNLVIQASNELGGTASTAVGVGSVTGSRQLADAAG
jgi:hypothetical protein